MKKLVILSLFAISAMGMFAKDEVVVTKGNVRFMQEKGKTAIVEILYPNTQIVEFDGNKVVGEFGTLEQFLREHNDDWTATIIQENTSEDFDVVAARMKKMANYDGQIYNFQKKKGMKFLASEMMQNNAQFLDEKQKTQLEKNGIIFGDRANADYKFVITVDTLDMGSNGGVGAAIAFGAFAKKAGGAILVGSMDVIDMHTNEVIAKVKLNKAKGGAGMTPDVRITNVLNEVFIKGLFPISKKKK